MPIFRVRTLQGEYAIESENRVTHQVTLLVGRYASYLDAQRECDELNREDQQD